MIEAPWEFIFAAIGAAGSAVTAVGIIFLWHQWKDTGEQLKLTQQQVNDTHQEIVTTLRAWLGIIHVYKNKPNQQVHIRNHGRVPAKIMKVQQDFNSIKITPKNLHNGQQVLSPNIIIFPDRETNIDLQDKTSMTTPYVGILITYQDLTNNTAREYGLIARDVMKRELYYEEIFAK